VEDGQDDPDEKEHPSDRRSHNGHADKSHRSGDEPNDQEQQGALAASFAVNVASSPCPESIRSTEDDARIACVRSVERSGDRGERGMVGL
jgi:hypothetical protein